MKLPGIATLADVEALEALPLAERHLPDSVLGVIRQGLERSDGRDALVFMPDATRPEQVVRYSYPDLIDAIERTAAGIAALATSVPVVSIVLPNLPETHFALWGAQTVGQANPVNLLLAPSALADIMTAARSSVVITLAPLPGTDLFERVARAIADVPDITTIVVVDPEPHLGATAKLTAHAQALAPKQRVIDFETLMTVPAQHLPTRSGDDVGALFHTGGTTGAPKIAQLTHANQVFVAWAANANRTMNRHRTIFGGLPLFHVNGALVTGLVSWMSGATVLLGPPDGFRAAGLLENFWRVLEHHDVGAMSAVPTIYTMLALQPVGDRDISSLEFCVCGAAPMPADAITRFEHLTGAPILEGYGLTEGACISTINPGFGERRTGSVGLRIPYQRIAIVEERNGAYRRVQPPGAPGSIVLAGPNVFAGYLRPEDDAAAWIVVDDERWYDTGDLGRIDEEGYVWLTGRKKDLIIRGGHNIDPAVIEAALASHPAVRSAAVIGSPDARLGEVPVAFVELAPPGTVGEAELLEHVGERIGERAAIPKRVHVVPTMPLTAIGKIFKPELKRREIERVVGQTLVDGLGRDRVELSIRLDPNGGYVGELAVIGASLTGNEAATADAVLARYRVRRVQRSDP